MRACTQCGLMLWAHEQGTCEHCQRMARLQAEPLPQVSGLEFVANLVAADADRVAARQEQRRRGSLAVPVAAAAD